MILHDTIKYYIILQKKYYIVLYIYNHDYKQITDNYHE